MWGGRVRPPLLSGQLVRLAHAFQDCRPNHKRGVDCVRLRERKRLRKAYGKGRWWNFKWYDMPAEIHWYEAHGIGAKEYKIKRILG